MSAMVASTIGIFSGAEAWQPANNTIESIATIFMAREPNMASGRGAPPKR